MKGDTLMQSFREWLIDKNAVEVFALAFHGGWLEGRETAEDFEDEAGDWVDNLNMFEILDYYEEYKHSNPVPLRDRDGA